MIISVILDKIIPSRARKLGYQDGIRSSYLPSLTRQVVYRDEVDLIPLCAECSFPYTMPLYEVKEYMASKLARHFTQELMYKMDLSENEDMSDRETRCYRARVDLAIRRINPGSK